MAPNSRIAGTGPQQQSAGSSQAAFLLCAASLRRGSKHSSNMLALKTSDDNCQRYDPVYELVVEQSLNDGVYHDDEDEAGLVSINIQDIVGVSQNTRTSLWQVSQCHTLW